MLPSRHDEKSQELICRLDKLASKISKKQKIIGLRQGEKFEEILISNTEKRHAEEKKDLWVIRHYDKFN